GEIDLDLVGDAAQKGFVAQLHGFDISGKNHQGVERDFKFAAAGQGQEFHAAIESGHPSIEKFLRAHALAGKIVQHENPVVGLHLQWSGVVTRHGIKLQLQHFAGEFAAGNYARPVAKDPAAAGAFDFRLEAWAV